jgi:hypothetical protein
MGGKGLQRMIGVMIESILLGIIGMLLKESQRKSPHPRGLTMKLLWLGHR